MFPIDDRKNALVSLGSFLSQFGPRGVTLDHPLNANYYDAFATLLDHQFTKNGWFTPDNMRHAVGAWGMALRADAVDQWFDRENVLAETSDRTVSVIMAGNIPMVGMHDMLSVIAAGHKLVAKLSSDDARLLPVIGRLLEELAPALRGRMTFTEERLGEVDAVIATGSGNTARYFEYYFKDMPALIRRNRSSVAILDGEESDEELAGLAEDVFRYFGKGCRSVSKIYVPEGYDLNKLFGAFSPFKYVIDNNKYANNYDYHKAIFLMNRDDIFENGFVLLKRSEKLSAPVSTLFYEEYTDPEVVREHLSTQKDQLQCIVSRDDSWPLHVKPGFTQNPELWQYADGVNVMKFLRAV
ncbi:MAG: acyl-CoA reductase [Flavobacteriales bacterium]|nr:acyl-CoA reductase [Flavobacteriales bacterium]